MVDFFKAAIPKTYEHQLLNNPCITFQGQYNYHTGEVLNYPIKGNYKNFEIEIKERKIIISGSVHIYYNLIQGKGWQNYNDFSFKNVTHTIEHLSKALQLEPKEMKIENLEIGVNVKLKRNVSEALTMLFIDWDTRNKYVNKGYKNGHLVEYKTVDRYAKFYDKGGQHTLPYHLLRYELKYMRNETIVKKAKIKTVHDLMQPAKFKLIVKNLKEEITKINLVDTLISPVELTANEANLFQNGINSMFWSNYSNQGLKAQKSKYRRQYMELIKRLGLDTTKNEIITNVVNKANALNAKNEI
jgi:hypothetical protein